MKMLNILRNRSARFIAVASVLAVESGCTGEMELVAPKTGDVLSAGSWETSSGGNGHAYEVRYVENGITWVEAKVAAESIGGHLVTIQSLAENGFVRLLVGNDTRTWALNNAGYRIGPWLGAFQSSDGAEPSGGWSWVTGEPFSFTNWDAREPNNLDGVEEDALTLFVSGMWNDFPAVPEPSRIAPVSGLNFPTIRAFVVEYE